MALFIYGCAARACAHTARGHGIDLHWRWQGWPMLGLGLVSAGYLIGAMRLYRSGRFARALGAWRAGAFAIGSFTLAIALFSPLDDAAAYSFAAHMTQHMLLMMVAAPLYAAGRAPLVGGWILARAQRRRLGSLWYRCALVNGLRRPLSVWLLASGALWFWHLPEPYAWAFANPWVHIVEHCSFFFTAFAFWSVVMDRRTQRPTAIVMVATFALHNGLLGALLTFAATPLYAVHRAGTLWSTPLADQQLAGLIMWIPAGFIHLLVFAQLIWSWLGDTERHNRSRAERWQRLSRADTALQQ